MAKAQVEYRAATEGVAKFRRAIRKRFYRGHDETVDTIIDEVMAPLISQIFSGRIESIEEAGCIAGEQLREIFSP